MQSSKSESDASVLLNAVPTLSSNQVEVDSLVGSGAFASVYKVKVPSLSSSSLHQRQVSLRKDSSTSTISNSSTGVFSSSDDDDEESSEDLAADLNANRTFYAMKKLQKKTLFSCARVRSGCARDLWTEASILSQLPRHENLVTLHGVSQQFWSNPMHGFILITYLTETLEERIQRCKLASPASLLPRRQQARVQQVGVSVARALAFLHSHQIVYRDLKPENIGFDVQGSVRLFDVAFARKLNDCGLVLEGPAGTPRYMAPEVLSEEPHGTAADVYSFGLLLWELVTLRKPFDKAQHVQHLRQMVLQAEARPPCWMVARKDVRDVMMTCWQSNPQSRPSAQDCVERLSQGASPNGTPSKHRRSASLLARIASPLASPKQHRRRQSTMSSCRGDSASPTTATK